MTTSGERQERGHWARLEDRGVLSVAGEDRVAFLQGLISNDVRKAGPERAIYAALLTPQGKFLHDFFLVEVEDAFLIDCEGERREDLRQRLSRYRLRSKVQIEDGTERFAVVAAWGGAAAAAVGLGGAERGRALPFRGGVGFVDPRLEELGVRALVPRVAADEALAATGLTRVTIDEYDKFRLAVGVPAGSRDMPIDKAFLLESGFDELGGVDWQKGCYVGQELTARTKYRGLVRKRLLPVEIDGPAPEPGTPVMLGDKHAGDLRSTRGGQGLALLRLEMVAAAERGEAVLTAGGARLSPRRARWIQLPEAAAAEQE